MKKTTLIALALMSTLYFVACGDDDEPCTTTIWYQDADNDDLGNPNVSRESCTRPTGYVADNTDPDDTCNGFIDICDVCNGTGEMTWYQDMDGDGLGNPDVSQSSCTQPTGYVADNTDTDDGGNTSGLHAAFAEFDTDNVEILLQGDNVSITTNGLPNHQSPYWSNTTERTINGPMGMHVTPAAAQNHPLFIEPTVTSHEQMAPGAIDDFNGSYNLTIPVDPQLAANTTATGLGAIGLAISGSVIYNDEEGPNVPLDNAAPSLDYTGAHTGPQSYHYHLEPKAWSNDDDKLIGIISDGFFLYGRKCNSTNDYPADLDDSGGHISTTQHTTTAEYHYHTKNELYLGLYYILFPGEYQGTPNRIQ